jgi:hypothetical protein
MRAPALAAAPDLAERVAALEHLAADQAHMIAGQARVIEAQEARIAALEARPTDDEDGRPRLASVWCRMAEAMSRTHYSRSGLLNLCRRGKVRFDFEGPHRLIDITSVPRKISSASAQSEHCK